MGAGFLRREAGADWRPVERSCFVDTKCDLKATTKVMKRPLFQSPCVEPSLPFLFLKQAFSIKQYRKSSYTAIKVFHYLTIL